MSRNGKRVSNSAATQYWPDILVEESTSGLEGDGDETSTVDCARRIRRGPGSYSRTTRGEKSVIQEGPAGFGRILRVPHL
jgi:hypothetical protein